MWSASHAVSPVPRSGLLASGFTETHYLQDGTEVSLAPNHTVSPRVRRPDSVLTARGSCHPESSQLGLLRPRGGGSLREHPVPPGQSLRSQKRAGRRGLMVADLDTTFPALWGLIWANPF